jgi:hypothetical protein
MSRPAAVSHQTVRLGRGPHAEPGDEVCVVELASMLADEPFSDHPDSVCPVIAAFLRTYNDRLDDRRRQDLYPVASLVVGSRRDARVEAARAELCRARALGGRGPRRGLRRLVAHRPPDAWKPADAGVAAARAVPVTEESHRRALAFIEELVAVRRRGPGSVDGPADGAAPLRRAALT